MDIKRKEVIELLTTDGKEISVGDTLIISAYDKCLCGEYMGLTKRNGLILKSLVDEKEFVICSKVIEKVIKGDLIHEDF